MRGKGKHARMGLTSALVLLAGTLPAAGDWLVTTDGKRVETRGAWEVKSSVVVFTSSDGVLSSLRLSDCDLAASEAATLAAREASVRPVAREPKRRGAVLVLTDADVDHVHTSAVDAETAEIPPPGNVVVSEWRSGDEEEGVTITGIVVNEGSTVAGKIELTALFRDAEGDLIESRAAVLSTSTLKPGQMAEFNVLPFGLFDYSSVEFDVQHFELLSARPGMDDGEP